MPTTVSFLFWNIRRASGTHFSESLGRLTGRGVDVVLFAEPPADDGLLLEAMNGAQSGIFYRVESSSRRLMLFSRLQDVRWDDRFSSSVDDRITAHEFTIANHQSILLIGAHLRSPNQLDPRDRAEWARKLALDIRRIEDDTQHARTLLVGDLNMNPFDDGLVTTTALHALMSRPLLEVVQRMKSRRDHPPFYNPMWSLLGDRATEAVRAPRVAGTYFHEHSQALASHFWQMYDQMLLRPDLVDSLTRLEILGSDGQNRLITRAGRPRRRTISDHLPLSFDLRLNEEGHDG